MPPSRDSEEYTYERILWCVRVDDRQRLGDCRNGIQELLVYPLHIVNDCLIVNGKVLAMAIFVETVDNEPMVASEWAIMVLTIAVGSA